MPSEETARLLADGIAKLGLSCLPWTKAQIQLRDRVGFLRAAGGSRQAGAMSGMGIGRRSERREPTWRRVGARNGRETLSDSLEAD